MDSNLTLRKAVLEDWPLIQNCFFAAAKAAWSGFLPAEWFAQMTGPPDRWYRDIARVDDEVAVMVAEYDGELAGFSVLRTSQDGDADPSTGEVDAFYVCPSLWGNGVGQALMQGSMEFLASRFRTSTLWTEVRNERPLRFYTLQGWVREGTERRRELGGEQLIETRLRI